LDAAISGSEQKVVSAGGVILHLGGGPWHIALVRRHEGDWVLPKGHLVSGETVEEAALREVQEETGIPPEELEISRHLGAFLFRDFEGDKREKLNHFLLMFYKGPRRKKLKTDASHAEAAWQPFPVEKIKLRYDYQKELLAKVASMCLADTQKAQG
jgi:8-oxo-dGTP pyrophosphatase MutT (NUDIX family)